MLLMRSFKVGMVVSLLLSSWSLAGTGKGYLAENGKKPGVVTTASGLQYKVIQVGTGISPVVTDLVQVHYHGTLVDGSVFDSSVDRGQPSSFALNQVITGWTEGLQTMKAGGKTIFYIPSKIAYGERAVGSIPANSTLIFEVELLKVMQLNIPKNLQEIKAYQVPKLACGRPPALPKDKNKPLQEATRKSGESYINCSRDFIKQGNAEMAGIIQLIQGGDENMRNVALDTLKLSRQGMENQLQPVTRFLKQYRERVSR